MTIEYRIAGVCRHDGTFGGCSFRAGDSITYDLGETEQDVAWSLAASLARSHWSDVRLLTRTISDWEALPTARIVPGDTDER